jgi:hypothetical protein
MHIPPRVGSHKPVLLRVRLIRVYSCAFAVKALCLCRESQPITNHLSLLFAAEADYGGLDQRRIFFGFGDCPLKFL